MFKKAFFLFLFIFFLFIGTKLCFSENKKKNNDDLYKEVELFSSTLAIIQNEYADETKTKDLVYGALKGMLGSLDAHSQFMDPQAYEELKMDTQGKFGGIGIEITIKNEFLTVITPIEDTPAWKAGVKANDRIIKINQDPTQGMALNEAVRKIRGKPKEIVELTIMRNNGNKLLNFKIIREMIKVNDIKSARILEEGIGYIKITEFRQNTYQEMSNALEGLYKQGIKALIIDLRNNPGGLLDSAVKVAGRFLEPNKLIIYTKGRRSEQNLEFFSDTKAKDLNLPLAVLVNAGSASGSEVVAGAFQDYKRALIIGEKSFGKGSVQTIVPLPDGSALRLTTSHYFTPSGKIIQDKGISPDIQVGEKKTIEDKEEAANKRPLEVKNAQQDKEVAPDISDYKTDPQLMRAVETLKTIQIYKNTK